jgi:hypothetical protein
MNRHHYLEAIETVLAWDLPDEAIANAVKYQSISNPAFEDLDAWDSYASQSEYMH